MRRITVVCLYLCISILGLNGQERKLPAISAVQFTDFTNDIVDSSTHAVVLWEQGRTEIKVDDAERALRVHHQYAVRIKILDQEGFEFANQRIPLYKYGSRAELVKDIKGFTHYFDGSQVHTTPMERQAIFSDEAHEMVSFTTFTLPDIKEGVIIDIYYEISSPDIFNFRRWEYQDEIPKLYSEYTAIIPALYEYNVTLKGVYPLSDQKSNLLREYFLLNGRRYDCSQLTYIMKDIPAFKEESFMLASVNYLSAIDFELRQYTLPNGATQNLTKEWKDVDRELLNDRNFGQQISRSGNFRGTLRSLLDSRDTDSEKAHKIYDYVKNQIRWNGYLGKYSQHGVRAAMDSRSGNIGDINLTLVGALQAAGLEAYPVILSTRSNGLPNSLFPVISDFDYVIAQVKLGEDAYFLDASEQNLPFGLLPLRCINGQGRIIYSKKSSDWIDLENRTDSERNFTILGAMDSTGVFTGTLTVRYKGLEEFSRREHITSFSSVDDYIEDQINRSTTFNIEDGKIEHLHNLSEPLQEVFQIRIDLARHVKDDVLIFHPVFINRMTSNPFTLEERTYSVDLGSRMKETYLFSMELPDGYNLQGSPNDAVLALPEEAARYSFLSHFDSNFLQVRQTLALNKAIYHPEEYFHLKEFYSRIVQHQTVDFVFQKLLSEEEEL